MILRAVIKYFKELHDQLDQILPCMTPEEKEIMLDLFTTKNYKPHIGKVEYKSFNNEFKEWLFSLPGFCHAFLVFDGKILI